MRYRGNIPALVFVVLMDLVSATAGAQSAPAPPTFSTDVLAAVLQPALARALAELKPGVTVSDQIVALTDVGAYNVGVAVVARPAGTYQGSLAHTKVTEIYYVLKGGGTQVTGVMIDPGPP